jgi:chromosome segregation ATPase
LSDISSLSASLSKEKAIVKELVAIIDRESSGISLGIDSVLHLVKSLESRLRDKSRTEEDRQRRIAQLDGEVSELEKKRGQLQLALNEKNTNADQLTSKINDIKRNLGETKDGIANATQENEQLDASLVGKKRQFERMNSDLQSMKKKHDFEIESLKKSQEEAKAKSGLLEAQHKALRLLVREKAVSYPELKTIDVLREQQKTTLEHLQKTTLSRRDEIESTIRALTKRGVLEFDTTNGEIKVLRPIDI